MANAQQDRGRSGREEGVTAMSRDLFCVGLFLLGLFFGLAASPKGAV